MLNIKSPYWFCVLKHFEQKRYVQNGLTIPYLIGARSIVEPSKPLFSIESFINEVSIFGSTMIKCEYLGAFVMGTLDSETTQVKEKYYKAFNNLVIIDGTLDDKKSLSELILYFKVLYEGEIKRGNYSRECGEWTNFSYTDIKRLKEVVY